MFQLTNEYVDNGVNVVDLSSKKSSRSILLLSRYFRSRRPIAVLAALTHVNIVAIIAKIISEISFKLVISEYSVVSVISNSSRNQFRL